MTPSGRPDPFAKPSANVSYLREAVSLMSGLVLPQLPRRPCDAPAQPGLEDELTDIETKARRLREETAKVMAEASDVLAHTAEAEL